MGNLALGGVSIDGCFDWNTSAVFRRERSSVARLSARRRIEDGAVKHNAALPGDGHHARVAGLEIRNLAEQAFRRHRQAFSSGGLTIDLRSSQSGTGNFFERRKSGLNSFD